VLLRLGQAVTSWVIQIKKVKTLYAF